MASAVPELSARKRAHENRPQRDIATRERCQAMADELFAVVRSGQVKIHIDQRFALHDVQAAHRALEARQTTGSTILTL